MDEARHGRSFARRAPKERGRTLISQEQMQVRTDSARDAGNAGNARTEHGMFSFLLFGVWMGYDGVRGLWQRETDFRRQRMLGVDGDLDIVGIPSWRQTAGGYIHCSSIMVYIYIDI